MKANLPPFDEFIQHILTQHGYSGLEVIQDLDSESHDDVPFVAWTFINQGQRDHGLWTGLLALTVLCETDDADSILQHLYKQVHRWDEPDRGALESKKVGVQSVTDVEIFSFVHEVFMNAKDVGQYNAQFRLSIIDYS